MEGLIGIIYYFLYRKVNPVIRKFPSWRSIKLDYTKNIHLVFFVGLGDALYGFPVFWEIQRKCRENGVKLIAHVSSVQSTRSSPAVLPVLELSGIFDEVRYFTGYDAPFWKYYFWQAAMPEGHSNTKSKDKYYPFLYLAQTNKFKHRLETIQWQYRVKSVPSYSDMEFEISAAGKQLSKKIQNMKKSLSGEAEVILFHFDARSSKYLWNGGKEFLKRLLAAGHIVLTPTSSIGGVALNKRHVLLDGHVDILSLAMILKALDASVVAINSLFWPVSQFANLRIFALLCLRDSHGSLFYHKNMFMITPMKALKKKVKDAVFACQYLQWLPDEKNKNLVHYDVDFVWSLYERWVQERGAKIAS